MKHLILILSAFFFLPTYLRAEEPVKPQSFMINPSIQSLANNTDLSDFQDMVQYYKQKSKNMNIAGGILTGIGAGALAFYGVLKIGARVSSGGLDAGWVDAAFLAPSLTFCAIGIPLLVYARKYKKQAISLQAGTQTAYEPCLQRMAQQPALGVRWSF